MDVLAGSQPLQRVRDVSSYAGHITDTSIPSGQSQWGHSPCCRAAAFIGRALALTEVMAYEPNPLAHQAEPSSKPNPLHNNKLF